MKIALVFLDKSGFLIDSHKGFREARFLLKMTRLQLAEVMNCSEQSIQNWEEGSRPITQSTLAKLADILKNPPDQSVLSPSLAKSPDRHLTGEQRRILFHIIDESSHLSSSQVANKFYMKTGRAIRPGTVRHHRRMPAEKRNLGIHNHNMTPNQRAILRMIFQDAVHLRNTDDIEAMRESFRLRSGRMISRDHLVRFVRREVPGMGEWRKVKRKVAVPAS